MVEPGLSVASGASDMRKVGGAVAETRTEPVIETVREESELVVGDKVLLTVEENLLDIVLFIVLDIIDVGLDDGFTLMLEKLLVDVGRSDTTPLVVTFATAVLDLV